MTRLNHQLEQHPLLGYLGSFGSLLLAWFNWFVEHADDLGKLIAIAAAVFGLVAGYYTMRIQRRTWRLAKSADRLRGKD